MAAAHEDNSFLFIERYSCQAYVAWADDDLITQVSAFAAVIESLEAFEAA